MKRLPKIRPVYSYQDQRVYWESLPPEWQQKYWAKRNYIQRLRGIALRPRATYKQIEKFLSFLDSHAVAHSVCEIFLENNHSPEMFWRVINDEWSRTDCANHNRRALYALFRRYR